MDLKKVLQTAKGLVSLHRERKKDKSGFVRDNKPQPFAGDRPSTALSEGDKPAGSVSLHDLRWKK